MTDGVNQSFQVLKTEAEQLLKLESYPYTQNEDLSNIYRLGDHSGTLSPKAEASEEGHLVDLAAQVISYQKIAWKVNLTFLSSFTSTPNSDLQL